VSKRTQIINLYRKHLQELSSIEQVHSRYKYLDEVNDFPTITFVPRGETRDHYGAGEKLATLQIDLRVYQYDRDIASLDLLMREVEDKTNNFFGDQLLSEFLLLQDGGALITQDSKFFELEASNFDAVQFLRNIQLTQVVTVGTDEGLMRPYQVGDMQILMTYEVDI
jgi:hypothetical protein